MSSRIYWKPYPPADRIGGHGIPFKSIIKERFFKSASQTRVVIGSTSDIAFLLGVVAGTLDANLLIQVNALVNMIKEHGEVELWEEQ